jgi:hypothetical protein
MSDSELSDEARELMDKVDRGEEHLFNQDEVIEVHKGERMDPATFRLPKLLRDALEIASTDRTGKSAIVRKAILEYFKENNLEALLKAKEKPESEETPSDEDPLKL